MTSLIDNNPHLFEEHKLHGSDVVIDGCNIVYRIYLDSQLDSRYGGEYGEFKKAIRSFFQIFLDCNIQPVVIMDGCYDESGAKQETWVERHKRRLEQARALVADFSNHHVFDKRKRTIKTLPLFCLQFFTQTLIDCGVKVLQCAREADALIAAMANHLKCAVISQDSDFFVFDLPYGYIPYDTINQNVRCLTNNTTTNYLLTKIYHARKLVAAFPGLDVKLLPLFATLTGNDFVEKLNFIQFFDHISKPKVGRKSQLNCSKNHCTMIGVLKFLQNKTIDEAVERVLSFVYKEQRDVLEKSIIDSLTMYKMDQFDIDDNEGDWFFEANARMLIEINLPKWWIHKFLNNAQIPANNLHLLANRQIFLPALSEDFDRDSVYESSARVLQAVYSIVAKFDKECKDEIQKHKDLAKDKVDSSETADEKQQKFNEYTEEEFRDKFGELDSDLESDPDQQIMIEDQESFYQCKVKEKFSINEYSRVQHAQRKQRIDETKSLPFEEVPSFLVMDSIDIGIRRAYLYKAVGLTETEIGNLDTLLPDEMHLFVCALCTLVGNKEERIKMSLFNALVTYCGFKDYIRQVCAAEKVTDMQCVKDFNSMSKRLISKHYKTDVAILHDLSRFQACLYCLAMLNEFLCQPFVSELFSIENFYSGRSLWNLCKLFATGAENGDTFSAVLMKLFESGTKIEDESKVLIMEICCLRDQVLKMVPESLLINDEKVEKKSATKKGKNLIRNQCDDIGPVAGNKVIPGKLLNNKFAMLTLI